MAISRRRQQRNATELQLDPAVDRMMRHLRLKIIKGGACEPPLRSCGSATHTFCCVC